MGVKGLYSLLANEPSRFGRQWSTDKDADIEIYVDAPALHHHFIETVQKRYNLPPSISIKDLDYASAIVSPCTIYKLTRAFCAQLLQAISKDSIIHFVFDGVASVHKEKQQVARVSENCELFDQAARSFINSKWNTYHVPHLWGEDALIEAVETDTCDRLSVHFAPSEAESYIADMIGGNADNLRPIVLSNDSDFLIYGVSFVPLHSLEYRSLEGVDILMGWEYSKEQFMAAHPQLDIGCDQSRFTIFTALAALAGCDYNLPSKLQRRISSARNIILNSNIANIRLRYRNVPTAKFTLIAVLKYIIHFCTHAKEKWMDKMIQSIVAAEGEKDKLAREYDLVAALEAIRNIYKGEEGESVDGASPASSMVELNRLLLQKILHCKPLIEICEGAKNKESAKKRKSKGKKKKKGSTNSEVENPGELYDRVGEGGSLWMSAEFVRCRDQLYAFLARHCPSFRDVPSDSCSNHVIEYCRSGGGNNVTYKGFKAAIPDHCDGMISNDNYGHSHVQDIINMIAPDLDEENLSLVENCFNQSPPKYRYLIFAMLLLDSDIDVMFLMTTILMSDKAIHKQKLFTTISKRKEYTESLGRIQIALQHIKFTNDAVTTFGKYPSMKNIRGLSPRHIFCDEHLLASWSIINESNENEFDDEFLVAIRHSINRSFRNKSTLLDERIDPIWSLWLKLKNI